VALKFLPQHFWVKVAFITYFLPLVIWEQPAQSFCVASIKLSLELGLLALSLGVLQKAGLLLGQEPRDGIIYKVPLWKGVLPACWQGDSNQRF
jgi:hypothetical protein